MPKKRPPPLEDHIAEEIRLGVTASGVVAHLLIGDQIVCLDADAYRDLQAANDLANRVRKAIRSLAVEHRNRYSRR